MKITTGWLDSEIGFPPAGAITVDCDLAPNITPDKYDDVARIMANAIHEQTDDDVIVNIAPGWARAFSAGNNR